MRFLFILSFLLITLGNFGQMITTPAPLTIEANTGNVSPGVFIVNWANNTDNLLVSISLDFHIGATLSFSTTTGLTKNYGYNNWTGVTSIVFYGTRDNINAALAAMTISMGATKTAIRINVEVSQYDASYVYNPTNKHFYKFISGPITYTNAKAGAAAQPSFKGKTPYLATITSQSENDFINNNISYNNIWVAMSDATTEGRWVYDAGPEANTNFWNTTVSGITNSTTTPYANTGITVTGQYANWCSGEPNNSDASRGGEDCIVAKSGGATCWNDLADGNSGSVSGYLVEISADYPSGSDYTGVYANYVVHNNDIAFTLNSSSTLNSSNISNLSNIFGGLQVNNGHTYTVNSSTILNTNKVLLSGTGKIAFTDATSKWTPGISSTTSTITHSPSTNETPLYWIASDVWANDIFGFWSGTYGHYLPWINSLQAWSAAAATQGHSIILSYATPAYITGIVTQGRQNMAQWVTQANVEVSLDNSHWTLIYTNATLNSDQTTQVNLLFPIVQYAKYVKVTPTNWFQHPSMRLGLLIKQ